MENLILIDGNSIFHRAYHSMPPFKTQSGELVNATYGFASMLLDLMNIEKPDYIAVTFDMKGKTFRHVEYAEYKATRKKAPDDLYAQLPRIKEVVTAFEIPIYEMEGYEADDLLGTLATQAEEKDKIMTYIVTSDRDALQLVSEKTNVIAPVRGLKETIVFDTSKVLEKYGLHPNQIIDMKGLQGDSSDNIKGVAGVGEKTARTLLQKYGTLEKIYDNLDEITGSLHNKLKNDKESAFFSKKLATIVLDVPKELDLNGCKVHEYDRTIVENLFLELEFKTLLKKFKNFDNHYSQKRIEKNPLQSSLF